MEMQLSPIPSNKLIEEECSRISPVCSLAKLDLTGLKLLKTLNSRLKLHAVPESSNSSITSLCSVGIYKTSNRQIFLNILSISKLTSCKYLIHAHLRLSTVLFRAESWIQLNFAVNIKANSSTK